MRTFLVEELEVSWRSVKGVLAVESRVDLRVTLCTGVCSVLEAVFLLVLRVGGFCGEAFSSFCLARLTKISLLSLKGVIDGDKGLFSSTFSATTGDCLAAESITLVSVWSTESTFGEAGWSVAISVESG